MESSVRNLFEFELDELARRKGVKWSRYGKDVIPMWIADSDYGVAKEIKDSIISAAQGEDLHYDDSACLSEMMAAKIRTVNKIPVSGEDMFITQGVIPPMWLACRYACSRGEEAVVTDPMYYSFLHSCRNSGGEEDFLASQGGRGLQI